VGSSINSGSGSGAQRRPAPDGLKMNSAQMKTTELQMLWKLVKDGEDRTLTAADLRLLMRVRSVLIDYQEELKSVGSATERPCMICGVPVSQCCC
jgi:hypothetical protein